MAEKMHQSEENRNEAITDFDINQLTNPASSKNTHSDINNSCRKLQNKNETVGDTCKYKSKNCLKETTNDSCL